MISERRNRIIAEFLGKTVRVTVDRPVRFCHKGILYPINYGFIPGVITDDQEEQDAYILGVSEPLKEFQGQVIGVVRRLDDKEDKLVVAPEGSRLNQTEIYEAVYFQERYFTTKIISLLEKSCGVVPYRMYDGQVQYLLLMQHNGTWSFPKGHTEPGETELETALRELQEETGLSAELIPESRASLVYPLSELIHKELVLYLGEVCGDLSLQKAEIAYHKWVTKDELKQLLFPDTYQAIEAQLR